jgi:hypothetical protein
MCVDKLMVWISWELVQVDAMHMRCVGLVVWTLRCHASAKTCVHATYLVERLVDLEDRDVSGAW